MNITNSFVAGTVHLRSLLRFPDISACFQTPGDLAAMSACPLCFFVATWSQSSSPTCSKPGTHCTHHLKPYMYNKRSHKIGVESSCPRKRARHGVFEMAWFLCASSSRSDIAAVIRSPQNLVAKDSSIRSLVKANVEDLCPESFRGHKAPQFASS